jgi:hypothetical protein
VELPEALEAEEFPIRIRTHRPDFSPEQHAEVDLADPNVNTHTRDPTDYRVVDPLFNQLWSAFGPWLKECFTDIPGLNRHKQIPQRWCISDGKEGAWSQGWAGLTVFFNPPYWVWALLKTIRHAYKEFKKAPLTSRFCGVLPAWIGDYKEIRETLSKFRVLRVIPKGNRVFEHTGGVDVGPTRWDVVIVGLGYDLLPGEKLQWPGRILDPGQDVTDEEIRPRQAASPNPPPRQGSFQDPPQSILSPPIRPVRPLPPQVIPRDVERVVGEEGETPDLGPHVEDVSQKEKKRAGWAEGILRKVQNLSGGGGVGRFCGLQVHGVPPKGMSTTPPELQKHGE